MPQKTPVDLMVVEIGLSLRATVTTPLRVGCAPELYEHVGSFLSVWGGRERLFYHLLSDFFFLRIVAVFSSSKVRCVGALYASTRWPRGPCWSAWAVGKAGARTTSAGGRVRACGASKKGSKWRKMDDFQRKSAM